MRRHPASPLHPLLLSPPLTPLALAVALGGARRLSSSAPRLLPYQVSIVVRPRTKKKKKKKKKKQKQKRQLQEERRTMNSEGWSESGTIRSSDPTRAILPFAFPPLLLGEPRHIPRVYSIPRASSRLASSRTANDESTSCTAKVHGTPSLSLSSDLEMRIRSRLRRFSAACSRPLLISRVSSQPILLRRAGLTHTRPIHPLGGGSGSALASLAVNGASTRRNIVGNAVVSRDYKAERRAAAERGRENWRRRGRGGGRGQPEVRGKRGRDGSARWSRIRAARNGNAVARVPFIS